MHRSQGQVDFADALVPPSLGHNARLERIAGCIDWQRIEALVCGLHSAREGRRSYAPLVMVKVLLLQQFYDLSDPRAEEVLCDSLSMRRFAGLGLADGTPDHSTICRFRALLRAEGLDRALFDEVLAQIDAQGLVLRRGTLMDATLLEAAARRPGRAQGLGAKGCIDRDADWMRKGGKAYYGYKAHVGVDEGSGLVRRAVLTPAKVSESEVAETLISGDERAVYADKAYEKRARRQRLKAAGIKDRIMHRGHRYERKPVRWKARRNALISPIRAAVERLFGSWKRNWGYRRVRYFSLAANATQLALLSTAWNLQKAAALRQ